VKKILNLHIKSLNIFFVYFISTHFLISQGCPNPAVSNCSPVGNGSGTSLFRIDGRTNIDFTFDDMNKYIRGITYSGATQLRLIVNPNNSSCKWKLVMIIENNGYLNNNNNNNEWEPLVYYGSSGNSPNLNLIQVAVWNGCGTPLFNGVFRTFSNNQNGDTLSIIPELPNINYPGPCDGSHTNGPGSYLTNYNEFSFNIDYRIIPGFALRPGSYQIRIRFCLVEIP